MGIEPTQSAWKAEVLPLNYIRITNYVFNYNDFLTFCQRLLAVLFLQNICAKIKLVMI